jgi:dipeptidase E
MKTLFLSSGGIRFPIIKRELLKILPKPPSEIKLAHIITATKVADDLAFFEKDKIALKETGFQVEEIDIADKTESELRELLKNKDIIYVQGGNGFYLLKEVWESGFDKVVKELLEKGVIYFGISAGTYIACPTIEMHEWKGVKDNHYGLTSLRAMDLVPFLISVHYNREKYREKVKEGIAHTTLLVKILTDDQALLIQDDKVTLVGEGDEVKI